MSMYVPPQVTVAVAVGDAPSANDVTWQQAPAAANDAPPSAIRTPSTCDASTAVCCSSRRLIPMARAAAVALPPAATASTAARDSGMRSAAPQSALVLLQGKAPVTGSWPDTDTTRAPDSADGDSASVALPPVAFAANALEGAAGRLAAVVNSVAS